MKRFQLLLPCILITFLFSGWSLKANDYSGRLTYQIIDTLPQYQRQYFTYLLNYYNYQSIVDVNGKTYLLVNKNYELYCLSKEPDSENWVKEKISTGNEGDILQAFIGLTAKQQRVIAYTYNEHFNFGSRTDYGYEFWFTTVIIVETPDGWKQKIYRSPSSGWSENYGYTPFAISSCSDGKVHITFKRDGWYTYGGELMEVIIEYKNDTVQWGDFTKIYTYNEGRVDRFVLWIGRQVVFPEKELLVYYKQSTIDKELHIDYIIKTDEGWQTPIRLRTTKMGNYNYLDLDKDRNGNYYFMYVENDYTNGAKLWLAKNNISLDRQFEPFEIGDTIFKASLFPQNDGSTNLVVYIKNQHPKIFNYKDTVLTKLHPLNISQEDSALWLGRSVFKTPHYAIMDDSENGIGFSNIYKDRTVIGDISTYNPMPIYITKFNWTTETGVSYYPVDKEKPAMYPNPARDQVYIKGINTGSIVTVYSLAGKLLFTEEYEAGVGLNISHLIKGIYLIKVDQLSFKLIKRN